MKSRTALQILAAAVLVASFATLGLAQGPKVVPAEKKVILIKGTQAWVPTGFLLRAGDKVTLTASGKVCFHNGSPQSCPGPNGWPLSDYPTSWPDDWGFCADPNQSVNHAVVLARVGTEIVPAGASLTFTGKAGPLAVGINDCSFTGQYSNTGEYSVVITVRRGN